MAPVKNSETLRRARKSEGTNLRRESLEAHNSKQPRFPHDITERLLGATAPAGRRSRRGAGISSNPGKLSGKYSRINSQRARLNFSCQSSWCSTKCSTRSSRGIRLKKRERSWFRRNWNGNRDTLRLHRGDYIILSFISRDANGYRK